MEQKLEAVRKAVRKGLLLVTETADMKYIELEDRIKNETEIPGSCYEVCATVVNRGYYDPTNDTLYPVCQEDINRTILGSRLSGRNLLYADTVYLKCDCNTCRKFEAQKVFKGSCIINGAECRALYTVRQSERYGAIMDQLYQVFQDNHISWQTINTGHFDKCYDVFLDISAQDGLTAKPADFKVDWGEFSGAVSLDILPLWNIQKIQFNSLSRMVPCIDGIFYENDFLLDGRQEGDGYLIQSVEDILEIRHEPGKIVIKTKLANCCTWEALRIVQEQTKRSMDYDAPLLTNHKSKTVGQNALLNGICLFLGKNGLAAVLSELDIRDFVIFEDYEVIDHSADYRIEQGMNWFLRDELFPLESRKVLLLKFREIKKGHYLSDTMIRFAVSQLQLDISEYRCVGVIV